ncbi:MAG: hydrogenase maturation protease [Bacteroidales bacterium]|nr:MAG: hydrogenase maturation protease [Bacteroidales bacterium]
MMNNNIANSISKMRSGKKLLFIGIGNVLRSDDGVGVYICKRLNTNKNINTLIVEVSIENYIKKVNEYNPDILILVDCVNFNRDPGYADLLPVEKIKDFTTSTHNISLKRISEFFKMEVLVLGIQPESLLFGEELSRQVRESADNIIENINQITSS